jgi:hypothetical protein
MIVVEGVSFTENLGGWGSTKKLTLSVYWRWELIVFLDKRLGRLLER